MSASALKPTNVTGGVPGAYACGAYACHSALERSAVNGIDDLPAVVADPLARRERFVERRRVVDLELQIVDADAVGVRRPQVEVHDVGAAVDRVGDEVIGDVRADGEVVLGRIEPGRVPGRQLGADVEVRGARRRLGDVRANLKPARAVGDGAGNVRVGRRRQAGGAAGEVLAVVVSARDLHDVVADHVVGLDRAVGHDPAGRQRHLSDEAVRVGVAGVARGQ